MSLSVGISLLGCSRYIKVVMADYSFASEIKFVPKLYLTSSALDYYDWEDDMEDFFWGHKLESRMKVFFARRTLSESLLKWWLKFQQGRVERGDVPCSTWTGMKAILQRRFDPPIKKSIVARAAKFSSCKEVKNSATSIVENSLGNNQHVRSSWGDSVVGDKFPSLLNQQDMHVEKKFVMPRCSSHPKQQVTSPICAIISKEVNDKRSVTASKLSFKPLQDVSPHRKEKKKARALDSDDLTAAPIDIVDDASNGLSMMAREIKPDGSVVTIIGKRSSIFQSECKIKDKVCKLVIDGGSFTNAISLDLVHSLSLSTRRLPTPRYMQWMNQSGTLKITHKVRVKFSIGTYMDTVDCDVAPMSACHLLLGRPWQFDLDATHGGRSNCYSFMHKGVHHVLKPIPESAIKAEVFASMKKKSTQAAATTPKPRTTLPKEGENDVPEGVILPQDSKNEMANSAPTVVEANILAEAMQPKPTIQSVMNLKKEASDFISKPRTALLQGREDDEPMAPLISSAHNNIKDLNIRFGSLIFKVEQRNMEEGVLGSAGNMPVKLTFSGANVGKNKVMKHESGCLREGHEGFVNQQERGGEARRVSKSSWRPNSSRSQPPRPPGPVWTKIITQATNGLRFW